MRRRLAAGIAGAVLIAAAVLAFALGDHPVVVGTDTVAPLLPAAGLKDGVNRCQPLSRVPPGATRVAVVTSSLSGRPGQLRVSILGPDGQESASGTGPVGRAGFVIHLNARTRVLHPAQICLQYSGPGEVTLAGEAKRAPGPQAVNGAPKGGVASVVFLRPGVTSWASRRDQILQRYANSQVSPFGEWTLWFAIAAAIGAALLALFWVVFRNAPDEGSI
jgi:hypothetical protein